MSAKEIDEYVKKDHKTRDTQYNSGLRMICKDGYECVADHPDVKYYCMCNNFRGGTYGGKNI